MSTNKFYYLDDFNKKLLLEQHFSYGRCIDHAKGMCGEIFIFDKGENIYPQYTCIKIPQLINGVDEKEIAKRFIRELEIQLTFKHHKLIHWAFDFDFLYAAPMASFRYWGNDLEKLIRINQSSLITKLSLLVYCCVGLRHCYNKGLIAHQDLKPANIFIQNIKDDYDGLPDLDIYNLAMIADFGLANAAKELNIFDGSRPYKAPEQWNNQDLSSATDIFALGVILYELITNGYHPIGIKLSDFWPKSQGNNSKKYEGSEPWKKWVKNGCKIQALNNINVPKDILVFIEQMLSRDASLRPSINDVIEFLLKQVNDISSESYIQLNFLINHYEEYSLKTYSLETDWPYLFDKWIKFKKQIDLL
jgi:serine/threonine protein kinase